MTKQKILLFIPLFIIVCFLIYTWTIILTTDINAVLQHYIAVLFFLIIIYFFFNEIKMAAILTGLFLIAGTFNLLSLTPEIIYRSYGIRIGSLEFGTPQFQLQSFGILVLFFILNFDTLVNTYLDFKERKSTGK